MATIMDRSSAAGQGCEYECESARSARCEVAQVACTCERRTGNYDRLVSMRKVSWQGSKLTRRCAMPCVNHGA
jgi:hypothetical protein